MDERWQSYYQATEGQPPRPTLLAGLRHWRASRKRAPGYALDLGAGTGRDTLELLSQGWRVRAYDGEAAALRRLAAKVRAHRDQAGGTPRLERRAARFENLDRLPDCDVINASFSLPFCPPPAFPKLWREIGRALRPGGVFCGQLLGPGDSWVSEDGLLGFSSPALDSLLAGYKVIERREEIGPGQTARGSKYWHIWHLVLERDLPDR
jgi:SAM-dependent methyltransferase